MPAEHASRPLQLICGDLRNLGDLMLLLQNLSPEVSGNNGEARIRRWQPLPDEIVRQVEHAGGTLVDGRNLLSYAWQCRGSAMVIGGGQLVRDNVSLRSLAGLALAAASVTLSGGRISARGLGVSHIRSRPHRILWRNVLRRCSTISVRDRASLQHLAELLPGAQVRHTADMVMLPTSATADLRQGGVSRDCIVVAPCIDAGEDRLPALESVERLVTAAHAALPLLSIVVACHDPRPDMDLAAAHAIARRCDPLALSILAGYDLSELVSLYRRSRLVLTNRLHSMIFGLHAGSAVVLIDDGNPKLHEVAHRFAVPRVRQDEGPEGIAAAVQAALAFDAVKRAEALRDMAERAATNLA